MGWVTPNVSPEGRRYIPYGGLDSPGEEFFFLVLPNWFCRTEAANDDTRFVFCACGIPPRNLSVIPECCRNVPHLSQLSDCLVAVALAVPLEASRFPLAMISRR